MSRDAYSAACARDGDGQCDGSIDGTGGECGCPCHSIDWGARKATIEDVKAWHDAEWGIGLGQDLIDRLKQERPDMAIIVVRTVDEYYVWDGDGEDPRCDGLDPYNVDVIARTIRGGVEIAGCSSLGGCYFEPGEPIGEIHGYLFQMVDEAVTELASHLADLVVDPPVPAAGGSRYAWIIDRDLIANSDAAEGSYQNAKGLWGPHDADPGFVAILHAGHGREFRIRDDDDEVYYEGRWVGPHWREYDGAQMDELAFGPLDDFGRGNAGATDIQYRRNSDNTGEWVTL